MKLIMTLPHMMSFVLLYFIFRHFLSNSIKRLFISYNVCSNPPFYLLSRLSAGIFFMFAKE